VLVQGLGVAVPGSLAGPAAVLALGRFIRALLFEVRPVDAGTLIVVPSAPVPW